MRLWIYTRIRHLTKQQQQQQQSAAIFWLKRLKQRFTSVVSNPKLASARLFGDVQGMDSNGQRRMAARDTGTSARRRRERRLRAQWHHEQQTVAIALVVGTHHRAQRGKWRNPNEAPRRQKTASAAGKRPGVLKEPEPQGEVALARMTEVSGLPHPLPRTSST